MTKKEFYKKMKELNKKEDRALKNNDEAKRIVILKEESRVLKQFTLDN